MITVFLLQHSYEWNENENTKIIGIYSSKEKAEAVIEVHPLEWTLEKPPG
ncbi:DUF7336 domain-containing protein [Paenibacillus chitinolyticus]